MASMFVIYTHSLMQSASTNHRRKTGSRHASYLTGDRAETSPLDLRQSTEFYAPPKVFLLYRSTGTSTTRSHSAIPQPHQHIYLSNLCFIVFHLEELVVHICCLPQSTCYSTASKAFIQYRPPIVVAAQSRSSPDDLHEISLARTTSACRHALIMTPDHSVQGDWNFCHFRCSKRLIEVAY